VIAPKIIDEYVKRQIQQSRAQNSIVDIDEVTKALTPHLPLYPAPEIKQFVFECVVRAGIAARWT